MKKIFVMVAIAAMFVMPAMSVSAETATRAELAHMVAQLTMLKTKLEQVQSGYVLGATTDTDFRVYSNGVVVAESYVPVTEALANDWCADMVASEAFANTTIECVWEGQLIFSS